MRSPPETPDTPTGESSWPVFPASQAENQVSDPGLLDSTTPAGKGTVIPEQRGGGAVGKTLVTPVLPPLGSVPISSNPTAPLSQALKAGPGASLS